MTFLFRWRSTASVYASSSCRVHEHANASVGACPPSSINRSLNRTDHGDHPPAHFTIAQAGEVTRFSALTWALSSRLVP